VKSVPDPMVIGTHSEFVWRLLRRWSGGEVL